MIEAKQLIKQFGKLRALDGLSIQAPEGSIYGLVGPNGAGKSTLIRCLTGVYRPEQGAVTLDGETVWENPGVKRKIACIPDEIFYFPQASIAGMADFYAGIYPTFDRELFRRLGQVFELPKGSPIRRFSKGMQKQAAFWLAISIRPEVLILDEPVDGLDPVMRRQVWQLLLSDVSQLTSGVNTNVSNYMFGSILTVSRTDAILSVILCVAVIICFTLLYPRIFAITFDETFARATGAKAGAYNTLLAVLTAVTVVLGMRMMGALLISSLIIFPPLAAMRVFRSFRSVTVCSAVFSVVCFVVGMTVSYALETPSGASVVCVNIIAFGVFAAAGKLLYRG